MNDSFCHTCFIFVGRFVGDGLRVSVELECCLDFSRELDRLGMVNFEGCIRDLVSCLNAVDSLKDIDLGFGWYKKLDN